MDCQEKVGYKSEHQATKAKKRLWSKKKMRVYFCPICYNYHLTSQKKII